MSGQKTQKRWKKYININFIKVKAHSGNYFNEKADILAKKAISNIEKKTTFIFKAFFFIKYSLFYLLI